MIFSLVGLLAGFLLNLFLMIPETGVSITPRFYGSPDSIEKIEKVPAPAGDRSEFSLKTGKRISILDSNGNLVAGKTVSQGLTSVSGNGRFFVKYRKVGDSAELYNIRGERFWKIPTLEYPSLSYSGKLIILVNGDQSRIRAVDENGRGVLKEDIYGRFCTVLSFSAGTDIAAAGFLDGSYYLISREKGEIYRGDLPRGKIVKGLAPGNNGAFLTLRYGDTESDYLRLINIREKSVRDIKLNSVRYTKSPLFVSDKGITTVLERESILNIDSRGKLIFRIVIPPVRDSFARISFHEGIYGISYSLESGGSKLILFDREGTILFSREYPGETYLDNGISRGFIFLKGSGHIYCYRLGV